MLRLGSLLPHQRPLFSLGDHVIFMQTVFAIVAMDLTDPARLRTQTDCSAWRPEKASIDNMSFFFVNAVDDIQRRFAHKYKVKRSQVIMESLTGVKKVDLGVRTDPGTLLIGVIMPYGREQDHDVLKERLGAFEQIQDENCFSTSRLSAYRRRMGRLRQEVNKPLRLTGQFQY